MTSNTELTKLIDEAQAANMAYTEHTDPQGELLHDLAQTAQRQVFLAILDRLLNDPDATVADLAENIQMQPAELAVYMGKEVVGWLWYRIGVEAES